MSGYRQTSKCGYLQATPASASVLVDGGLYGKAQAMKSYIGGDRRCGERRRDTTAQGGRRKGERRRGERRRFVRLYYPPTDPPKVLNENFRIINISQRGIVFVCRDPCNGCPQPITLKSVLDLSIQFHDGQILDVKVRIIRCQSDLSSNENTFAGIIEHGISPKIISKEQAYLLRHFPDFCRSSVTVSKEHLNVPLYVGEEHQ